MIRWLPRLKPDGTGSDKACLKTSALDRKHIRVLA
jgi:hypothetical protein